jgi:hypothetical protein
LGKTLDFIECTDFFDQSVSFFAGNFDVEVLEIGTVLEFVVQQSEHVREGEDSFDFVEDWSETSLLIGVGSGDGVFDEIVDPGEDAINRETSVVEILDEFLDGGFGSDGVDEFRPFGALEVDDNSDESTVSLEMVSDNSLDVFNRDEGEEIKQIVEQAPARFLDSFWWCPPLQKAIDGLEDALDVDTHLGETGNVSLHFIQREDIVDQFMGVFRFDSVE